MNRLIISALVALLVTVSHLWAISTPLGERFEFLGLDLLFAVRGAQTPPNDVVIVAIDENSYSSLNVPLNGAWPRALHARLLHALKELGAGRIVFDVLFFDATNQTEDAALGEAIKLTPTILGADIGQTYQQTGTGGFTVDKLNLPLPILREGANGIALVGVDEDYGSVRHFSHSTSKVAADLPSLAQAAAGALQHGFPNERDLLNYYGPEGTIPSVSVQDVIALFMTKEEDPMQPPPAILEKAINTMRSNIKGKTVLIGLKLKTEIGAAQKDSYATPFLSRGRTFGVEVHATATANIRTGTWIRRLSPGLEYVLLGLVTFSVAISVFLLRPHWAGLLTVSVVAMWGLLGLTLFSSGTFVPGITMCCVVLPTAYLGSTLYYYFASRRTQMQTKRAFEFYLAPEMAELMAKDPKSLALGGQAVFATALFTDIQGFSTITENMQPEQVAVMLNAYFTEVMEAIFPRKGTLIKFIGDSVFALWGAPIKMQDHGLKAVEAALAIQQEVEKFNASNRFPPLKTRIGIHSGSMLVGNLGSAKRFDFTAIGDSVNLASRVEGVNKYLGTEILFTETVFRELRGQFQPLFLGSIQVAGKQEVVGLYTIPRNPLLESDRTAWETALRDFKYRRWQKAATSLWEVAERNPWLEVAARLYLNEIARYEKQPPLDTWEGTLSIDRK